MTTIFVGTVNGPVVKEKDMNEAYVLLKNAIVSKKFLVQVIIETVPVSNNYRNYRNFKAVIKLYSTCTCVHIFNFININNFLFLVEDICWCRFIHYIWQVLV